MGARPYPLPVKTRLAPDDSSEANRLASIDWERTVSLGVFEDCYCTPYLRAAPETNGALVFRCDCPTNHLVSYRRQTLQAF